MPLFNKSIYSESITVNAKFPIFFVSSLLIKFSLTSKTLSLTKIKYKRSASRYNARPNENETIRCSKKLLSVQEKTSHD